MDTIRQWLERLGFSEYAEAFERNAVDLELLCELKDEDLKELGIHVLGHRKKLLKAIEALRSTDTIAPPRSPDSYTPKHLADRILTSRGARKVDGPLLKTQ